VGSVSTGSACHDAVVGSSVPLGINSGPSIERRWSRGLTFRSVQRRECGLITDPQLRQSCLDSFAQYEPAGAYATPTRRVASSNRLVDGTAAASNPLRTVVVLCSCGAFAEGGRKATWNLPPFEVRQ
jgi:hypothetical protein